jgi:hypothetical protein
MIEHLRIPTGYWYVASAYTLYPDGMEEAFRMACRIAGKLMGAGIPIFCPIAHSHPIAEHGGLPATDHDLWITADTPLLEAAHGLIVAKMKGWELSYGVASEIEICHSLNKPVHFLSLKEIGL